MYSSQLYRNIDDTISSTHPVWGLLTTLCRSCISYTQSNG